MYYSRLAKKSGGSSRNDCFPHAESEASLLLLHYTCCHRVKVASGSFVLLFLSSLSADHIELVHLRSTSLAHYFSLQVRII